MKRLISVLLASIMIFVLVACNSGNQQEIEEIFEEDSAFSNNDEALAAMEFYDSPDEIG